MILEKEKKLYKYCLLLSFFTVFHLSNINAQTELFIPKIPAVNAGSYMLIDINSKAVLAEKNADKRIEPASITKIMTAHIVFQELKNGNIQLTDKVLISRKAWKTEGSRMFIEVNKEVSVDDLLKGLIIQSGNDAAVALAEYIAGSEKAFVSIMNKVAKNLEMNDTNYVNTTGLPNIDHYTTPRDIVKITAATIQKFPEFYKLYSRKEFTFNNIKQYNRNSLLWRDDSVDGVKTGHTRSAGYCLISSAKRKDMRLISVIMGAKSKKSRAKDSAVLLNFGFRFYESFRLYKAGEELKKVRVWKSKSESISLGLSEDLYVTTPRNKYNDLNAQIDLDQRIYAPIKKGNEFGEVFVSLSGKELVRKPLIALEDANLGSWWEIAIDSIKLWFVE